MKPSKSNDGYYPPSLNSWRPTHPDDVGSSHGEDRTIGHLLKSHRKKSFNERRIGLILCLAIIFPLTFSIFIQHWWSIRASSNTNEHCECSISHQVPSMTFSRNLKKIPEHHTELETHRYQLSLNRSSLPELYQIMSKQLNVIPQDEKPFKKILYWNDAITLPRARPNNNFGMGTGRDRYKSAGCPVWQCETSEDRSKLLDYDVIIFNQRTWNLSDLPERRLPHQRYIFYSREPAAWSVPGQDESYDRMKDFFNWTMTYRMDSDVVHPYGWFEPIDPAIISMHPGQEDYQKLMNNYKEFNSVNYAEGKTKLVVFFTSFCQSKSNREEFVRGLRRKGIPVDTFGSCGQFKCGGHSRSEEEEENCLKLVTGSYKFFLAFHNSLCLDYAAERFFEAMRYPIIPIVMDIHGHHARISPPHSFINIADFPSARMLADYLVTLDQNDALYNEYFWWKSHYVIRNGRPYQDLHLKTFCSLCAALHDPTKQLSTGSYPDMKHWWRERSECSTLLFDGFHSIDQIILDEELEYEPEVFTLGDFEL